MDEQWKDIYYYDFIKGEWIDYRGLYAVSSEGHVKSLNYKHTGKEKILKPGKTKTGYEFVALSKNGKITWLRVNRLVAFMFISNPEHKIEVDHINTNQSDNRVENLRWVTSKENSNNPLTRKKYSETLSTFIFFIKQNGEKWFNEPLSLRELSRKTKISLCALQNSLHNKKPLTYNHNAKYDHKYIGSIVVSAEED